VRDQPKYSQTQEPAFVTALERRRMLDQGFFTRHLRHGMRLLDCGCGPGPVTFELAGLISPGEVVGLDIDANLVERARQLAQEKQVANVTFEVGDVIRLPYPDASFDAVYAQLVLFHLRDAVAALKEMRRVLRPGGIVGTVDSERALHFFEPQTPASRRRAEIEQRAREFTGDQAHFARQQRRLLLEAGFSRAEQAANIGSAGTPAAIAELLPFFVGRFRGAARTALQQGWIDAADVELLLEDLQQWAKRPDAFATVGGSTAVGFVD
jgi:ubiquinone/menaquinone biosynthesis C-methylase UbiE